MIPKIIWQTHEWDYNNLPIVYKKTSQTWKNLNPLWEYKYFNRTQRESFIVDNYPHLVKTYLDEPGVRQADIWRYCVVHKYGGVYADMDSVCVKPLDYMLENYKNEDLIALDKGSVGPKEKEKGFVNNSNFAAVQDSKLLKNIIDDLYTKVLNGERSIKWDMPDSWYSFAKYASNLDGMVFDAALHTAEYKTTFLDFMVDLYGEKIMYSEYIKRNELNNDI